MAWILDIEFGARYVLMGGELNFLITLGQKGMTIRQASAALAMYDSVKKLVMERRAESAIIEATMAELKIKLKSRGVLNKHEKKRVRRVLKEQKFLKRTEEELNDIREEGSANKTDMSRRSFYKIGDVCLCIESKCDVFSQMTNGTVRANQACYERLCMTIMNLISSYSRLRSLYRYTRKDIVAYALMRGHQCDSKGIIKKHIKFADPGEVRERILRKPEGERTKKEEQFLKASENKDMMEKMKEKVKKNREKLIRNIETNDIKRMGEDADFERLLEGGGLGEGTFKMENIINDFPEVQVKADIWMFERGLLQDEEEISKKVKEDLRKNTGNPLPVELVFPAEMLLYDDELRRFMEDVMSHCLVTNTMRLTCSEDTEKKIRRIRGTLSQYGLSFLDNAVLETEKIKKTEEEFWGDVGKQVDRLEKITNDVTRINVAKKDGRVQAEQIEKEIAESFQHPVIPGTTEWGSITMPSFKVNLLREYENCRQKTKFSGGNTKSIEELVRYGKRLDKILDTLSSGLGALETSAEEMAREWGNVVRHTEDPRERHNMMKEFGTRCVRRARFTWGEQMRQVLKTLENMNLTQVQYMIETVRDRTVFEFPPTDMGGVLGRLKGKLFQAVGFKYLILTRDETDFGGYICQESSDMEGELINFLKENTFMTEPEIRELVRGRVQYVLRKDADFISFSNSEHGWKAQICETYSVTGKDKRPLEKMRLEFQKYFGERENWPESLEEKVSEVETEWKSGLIDISEKVVDQVEVRVIYIPSDERAWPEILRKEKTMMEAANRLHELYRILSAANSGSHHTYTLSVDAVRTSGNKSSMSSQVNAHGTKETDWERIADGLCDKIPLASKEGVREVMTGEGRVMDEMRDWTENKEEELVDILVDDAFVGTMDYMERHTGEDKADVGNQMRLMAESFEKKSSQDISPGASRRVILKFPKYKIRDFDQSRREIEGGTIRSRALKKLTEGSEEGEIRTILIRREGEVVKNIFKRKVEATISKLGGDYVKPSWGGCGCSDHYRLKGNETVVEVQLRKIMDSSREVINRLTNRVGGVMDSKRVIEVIKKIEGKIGVDLMVELGNKEPQQAEMSEVKTKRNSEYAKKIITASIEKLRNEIKEKGDLSMMLMRSKLGASISSENLRVIAGRASRVKPVIREIVIRLKDIFLSVLSDLTCKVSDENAKKSIENACLIGWRLCRAVSVKMMMNLLSDQEEVNWEAYQHYLSMCTRKVTKMVVSDEEKELARSKKLRKMVFAARYNKLMKEVVGTSDSKKDDMALLGSEALKKVNCLVQNAFKCNLSEKETVDFIKLVQEGVSGEEAIEECRDTNSRSKPISETTKVSLRSVEDWVNSFDIMEREDVSVMVTEKEKNAIKEMLIDSNVMEELKDVISEKTALKDGEGLFQGTVTEVDSLVNWLINKSAAFRYIVKASHIFKTVIQGFPTGKGGPILIRKVQHLDAVVIMSNTKPKPGGGFNVVVRSEGNCSFERTDLNPEVVNEKVSENESFEFQTNPTHASYMAGAACMIACTAAEFWRDWACAGVDDVLFRGKFTELNETSTNEILKNVHHAVMMVIDNNQNTSEMTNAAVFLVESQCSVILSADALVDKVYARPQTPACAALLSRVYPSMLKAHIKLLPRIRKAATVIDEGDQTPDDHKVFTSPFTEKPVTLRSILNFMDSDRFYNKDFNDRNQANLKTTLNIHKTQMKFESKLRSHIEDLGEDADLLTGWVHGGSDLIESTRKLRRLAACKRKDGLVNDPLSSYFGGRLFSKGLGDKIKRDVQECEELLGPVSNMSNTRNMMKEQGRTPTEEELYAKLVNDVSRGVTSNFKTKERLKLEIDMALKVGEEAREASRSNKKDVLNSMIDRALVDGMIEELTEEYKRENDSLKRILHFKGGSSAIKELIRAEEMVRLGSYMDRCTTTATQVKKMVEEPDEEGLMRFVPTVKELTMVGAIKFGQEHLDDCREDTMVFKSKKIGKMAKMGAYMCVHTNVNGERIKSVRVFDSEKDQEGTLIPCKVLKALEEMLGENMVLCRGHIKKEWERRDERGEFSEMKKVIEESSESWNVSSTKGFRGYTCSTLIAGMKKMNKKERGDLLMVSALLVATASLTEELDDLVANTDTDEYKELFGTAMSFTALLTIMSSMQDQLIEREDSKNLITSVIMNVLESNKGKEMEDTMEEAIKGIRYGQMSIGKNKSENHSFMMGMRKAWSGWMSSGEKKFLGLSRGTNENHTCALKMCMDSFKSKRRSMIRFAPKKQRGGTRPLSVGNLENICRTRVAEILSKTLLKKDQGDLLSTPKRKNIVVNNAFKDHSERTRESDHRMSGKDENISSSVKTFYDNVDHTKWGDVISPMTMAIQVRACGDKLGEDLTRMSVLGCLNIMSRLNIYSNDAICVVSDLTKPPHTFTDLNKRSEVTKPMNDLEMAFKFGMKPDLCERMDRDVKDVMEAKGRKTGDVERKETTFDKETGGICQPWGMGQGMLHATSSLMANCSTHLFDRMTHKLIERWVKEMNGVNAMVEWVKERLSVGASPTYRQFFSKFREGGVKITYECDETEDEIKKIVENGGVFIDRIKLGRTIRSSDDALSYRSITVRVNKEMKEKKVDNAVRTALNAFLIESSRTVRAWSSQIESDKSLFSDIFLQIYSNWSVLGSSVGAIDKELWGYAGQLSQERWVDIQREIRSRCLSMLTAGCNAGTTVMYSLIKMSDGSMKQASDFLKVTTKEDEKIFFGNFSNRFKRPLVLGGFLLPSVTLTLMSNTGTEECQKWKDMVQGGRFSADLILNVCTILEYKVEDPKVKGKDGVIDMPNFKFFKKSNSKLTQKELDALTARKDDIKILKLSMSSELVGKDYSMFLLEGSSTALPEISKIRMLKLANDPDQLGKVMDSVTYSSPERKAVKTPLIAVPVRYTKPVLEKLMEKEFRISEDRPRISKYGENKAEWVKQSLLSSNEIKVKFTKRMWRNGSHETIEREEVCRLMNLQTLLETVFIGTCMGLKMWERDELTYEGLRFLSGMLPTEVETFKQQGESLTELMESLKNKVRDECNLNYQDYKPLKLPIWRECKVKDVLGSTNVISNGITDALLVYRGEEGLQLQKLATSTYGSDKEIIRSVVGDRSDAKMEDEAKLDCMLLSLYDSKLRTLKSSIKIERDYTEDVKYSLLATVLSKHVRASTPSKTLSEVFMDASRSDSDYMSQQMSSLASMVIQRYNSGCYYSGMAVTTKEVLLESDIKVVAKLLGEDKDLIGGWSVVRTLKSWFGKLKRDDEMEAVLDCILTKIPLKKSYTSSQKNMKEYIWENVTYFKGESGVIFARCPNYSVTIIIPEAYEIRERCGEVMSDLGRCLSRLNGKVIQSIAQEVETNEGRSSVRWYLEPKGQKIFGRNNSTTPYGQIHLKVSERDKDEKVEREEFVYKNEGGSKGFRIDVEKLNPLMANEITRMFVKVDGRGTKSVSVRGRTLTVSMETDDMEEEIRSLKLAEKGLGEALRSIKRKAGGGRSGEEYRQVAAEMVITRCKLEKLMNVTTRKLAATCPTAMANRFMKASRAKETSLGEFRMRGVVINKERSIIKGEEEGKTLTAGDLLEEIYRSKDVLEDIFLQGTIRKNFESLYEAIMDEDGDEVDIDVKEMRVEMRDASVLGAIKSTIGGSADAVLVSSSICAPGMAHEVAGTGVLLFKEGREPNIEKMLEDDCTEIVAFDINEEDDEQERGVEDITELDPSSPDFMAMLIKSQNKDTERESEEMVEGIKTPNPLKLRKYERIKLYEAVEVLDEDGELEEGRDAAEFVDLCCRASSDEVIRGIEEVESSSGWEQAQRACSVNMQASMKQAYAKRKDFRKCGFMRMWVKSEGEERFTSIAEIKDKMVTAREECKAILKRNSRENTAHIDLLRSVKRKDEALIKELAGEIEAEKKGGKRREAKDDGGDRKGEKPGAAKKRNAFREMRKRRKELERAKMEEERKELDKGRKRGEGSRGERDDEEDEGLKVRELRERYDAVDRRLKEVNEEIRRVIDDTSSMELELGKIGQMSWSQIVMSYESLIGSGPSHIAGIKEMVISGEPLDVLFCVSIDEDGEIWSTIKGKMTWEEVMCESRNSGKKYRSLIGGALGFKELAVDHLALVSQMVGGKRGVWLT